MSVYGDVGTSEPIGIWDGVAAWTVEGERATLALIELEPNSVVPEHSHDNEQVGVLLHGSLTFRIGGETRQLGPGSTWSIPSNTPHDVVTGPDGASLVEAFVPVRADWGPLERVSGRRPRWPDLR
jgi:quercetin dioxygenase-like cupin family protein